MGIERPLVILPAYNEAAALPGVLAELAGFVSRECCVVVSDGSSDDTAAVARRAGVNTLELPFNLGVGGAMRAGFRYAQRQGFEYVVQLDADGQHDPAQIATLVQRMRETDADVVIGARFAGKGAYAVSGPRRWAMGLLRVIMSRVVHTRLTDVTSGFKLIGPTALGLYAREYPAEYLGDTVEALVIARRHHLKVEQVAVEMRERTHGQPSQSFVRSTVYLARAMMSLLIGLTRPGSPREVEAQ